MPFRSSLLVAFLLMTPAAAQQPASVTLDPETKAQTLWRVVVQTRPHPLLTPNFRHQLQRDIFAALEPGMAQLGTVDVIDLAEVPADKWDPMWQQLATTGFPAIETPRDLTGVKTHFLRIEYRDGAYHLEARQHDGFTGLHSPMVRKQSVRAAELVGRTAGLMLDRDFGVVGTAEFTQPKATETKIRIRGGELGSIDRFVKVGDVFAISTIRATTRPAPPPARTATGKIIAPPPGSVPPPALAAQPREFTLLRVVEVGKDGTCRCAIFTDRNNGLPAGAGIAAYRCMKLPTIQAPVTLRMVSLDGRAHQTSALNVVATDRGFGGKIEPRDTLDFREGVFRSSKSLSNIACVVVSVGPTQSREYAIPVLGTDPVTLKFNLDPQAEEKAAFERAVLALSGRAADARMAQTAGFTAVAKLITDKKNAEALARARASYRAADDAVKTLREEIAQLNEQSSKSPQAKPLLAAVEQQVAALERANTQLANSIRELEQIVARENDPSVAATQQLADSLVTKVGLFLARGDVDEALNAYDQLITLRPDDPEAKKRRDKLKAEWATKGEDHAKARDFLVKTWPALATVQDLKDAQGTLRNAVETCKKANDKHAFRKLLTALGEFPTKMNALVEPLDPNSDTDRKTITAANEVRTVVGGVETDVTEFLKKAD